MPLVAIVMGSESDLSVMEDAAEVLREFEIAFESRVLSAHRTPHIMADYAASAHERGIQVIIAGAGGAAHLPGMIASYTPLPVIGVPVPTRSLQGLDSLLSIVQMPNGVPVATVAIGKARNAAVLAVQIIGAQDAAVREKMIAYKEGLIEKVKTMDRNVQEKLGG